jgi:PadR family transcriptional regulator, regulatory protein AphA
MPKTNYAKYMIMGLLSGSPMTGYDIKRWADEFLKYLVMDMSYGQIYPVLNRLEKDGLATVTRGTTGKRPDSKTYQLTEKGLAEVTAWVRSPDTKEYDLLLKMCYGSLIHEEEMIRKLDAYRKKREEELAMMSQYLGEAGDEATFGPNAPYLKLITMLGLSYFKEEVSWCDQAIAMLEGREVT